jgi:hypothetical protein
MASTRWTNVGAVGAIALLSCALGSACGADGTPVAGTSEVATGAGSADSSSGSGSGSGSFTASVSGTADASTTGALDHGPLEGLELAPTDLVLAVELGAPAELDFTALGRYADGTIVDVSDAASFELERAGSRLGTMDGARLELPAFSEIVVGTLHVTAALDGHEARARVTVVAHARSGPDAQALFVLPYLRTGEDPAGPSVQVLDFDTAIDRLDVLVNMDATGSMGGPIAELQATLARSVIPSLRRTTADAWFGVAAFMDFPIDPFGVAGCDQPFVLLQALGPSADAAQAAALGLTDGPFGGPVGCGNDAPASHVEALWQIATGEGLDGPGPTFVAPSDAGFRAGALPIVASITAARSHDPAGSACGGVDYDADPAVLAVAADRAQTEAALEGLCARVVTLAVSDFEATCSPLADGVALAEATDAMVHPAVWSLAPGGRPPGCAEGQCCTGQDGAGVLPGAGGRCPLAYRIPFGGGGLGERLVDAVTMQARHAPLVVTVAVQGTTEGVGGTPLPPGLDTASFIASATPSAAGPSPLPALPDPVVAGNAFVGVIPSTPVSFEVVGHNEIVPATDEAQLFSATLAVRGDGCFDLDVRPVLVLVPPASES